MEYPPGELLKTPEEIAELDRLEAQAEETFKAKQRAIQKEYDEATHEAGEELQAVLKPALEKWQTFQRPYFEARQRQDVALNDEMLGIWGPLRRGWRKCPKCGFVNFRYVWHCQGEVGFKLDNDGDRVAVECGLNLIAGGRR